MTFHSPGNSSWTPGNVPFVRDLDAKIRSAILVGATTASFDRGDRILAAGKIPDRLCIILSGMVELCGTVRDAECGVLLLNRGDLIFPMALLHEEPCLTSATALTRSKVLMLHRRAVREQAQSNPALALALTRVIGAQFRMAVRHIIDLKSRSAAERLAAFLLRFVDRSDEQNVDLPFTKATLASRLGVSRETLSRTIQVVADNGIVLRGTRIIVRDRTKAEDFCGPEPYPYRSEHRLDVHAF